MSTNKTEHLNLHAWEPDDPFRRDEINENFSVLDGLVHTVSTELTRIAYGSYVGNGLYGADYPNSITFPFEPKIVFIENGDSNHQNAVCWIRGFGSGAITNDSNAYSVGLSWSENTLSWYTSVTSAGASYQLNYSGHRYHYCAFG